MSLDVKWSVILICACGSSPPSSSSSQVVEPECISRDVFVATSDGSSSYVGGFGFSTFGKHVAMGEVGSDSNVVKQPIPQNARSEAYVHGHDLGGDPILAVSQNMGPRLFMLARGEDTLFELSSDCGLPIAKWVLRKNNRESLNNPQDIAVSSDGNVWLPMFNRAGILVQNADISEGSNDQVKPQTWIDLSSYDDDHNPQASAIYRSFFTDSVLHKSVEYMDVVLEKLDDHTYKPKQAGEIIRFFADTKQFSSKLILPIRNPFGHGSELRHTELITGATSGSIYLAAPGDFNLVDEHEAGIAIYDPSTFSAKMFMSEAKLHQNIVEVAVSASHDCGVGIAAGTGDLNPTSLFRFHRNTGELYIDPAVDPSHPFFYGPTPGYDLIGLAWVDDLLYVGDRRRNAKKGGYPIHRFKRDEECILHELEPEVYLPQPLASMRAKLW